MSEFRIITFIEKEEWDNLVTSFPNHDVYYLCNYAKAFYIHGDGLPLLLYYEQDSFRAVSVILKRDIAWSDPFIGSIHPGSYYDLATPYGYGGFIFDGNPSPDDIRQFYETYIRWLQRQNIVSEFVRYHPLLHNAEWLREVSCITDLGRTIAIDLQSPEVIWNNFTPQNRNNIRKAQNSDVVVRHGKDWKLFVEFSKMYEATMDQDEADPYYYFEEAFYRSICYDLTDHQEVFYAERDGKILAMVIMLFANKLMHAHLACSLCQYRFLQPSNLLFYEASLWGCSQGFRALHLGGGVCCDEDNLFRFKQSFNRHSDNRFSVGKYIVNQKIYESLVTLREEIDPDFQPDSLYFPLYRASQGNYYHKHNLCTCKDSTHMDGITLNEESQLANPISVYGNAQ